MFADLQRRMEQHARSLGVRESDVADVVGDCWLAMVRADADFTRPQHEQVAYAARQLSWTVSDHWRRTFASKRDGDKTVPLEFAPDPEHYQTPDVITDARAALRAILPHGALLSLRSGITRSQLCRLRKKLSTHLPC